jgi:hypothetical protein
LFKTYVSENSNEKDCISIIETDLFDAPSTISMKEAHTIKKKITTPGAKTRSFFRLMLTEWCLANGYVFILYYYIKNYKNIVKVFIKVIV